MKDIHSSPATDRLCLWLDGALLLMFLVLKLTGAVSWPWWVVLMPLWISVAYALIAGVGLAIVHHAIGRGGK